MRRNMLRLSLSTSASPAAAALRTVDPRGGLDAFLAKEKDVNLSDRALKIKKDIAKSSDTAAALEA